MKRIGIISDTHNKLPQEALDSLRGCDRIIHAGDICEPHILWELETVAPLTAVLGNNDHLDFGSAVNPVATFVVEGVRFLVVHEPRHINGALASLTTDQREDPLVIIHGHTHVPKLEWAEGMPHKLLMCPGAVNRSRDPEGRKTIGVIEVEDGKVLRAEIQAIC